MATRIPDPIRRDPTPRPRSLAHLHHRGRDLSLDTVSGQTLTLTRASARTTTDTGGNTVSVVHSMPAWGSRTLYDAVQYAGLEVGTADVLSSTVVPEPATMSGLIEFVHDSNPGHTTGRAELFSIGTASNLDPYLTVYIDPAYYAIEYQPVGGGGGAGATVTRNSSDLTKLLRIRWMWNANGGVQIAVTLNGGAETVGSATAAITRVAWATGTQVRINANGWLTGGIGWYRDVKVFPGVNSLATMDTLI